MLICKFDCLQIKADFNRVMGKEDLAKKIKSNFKDVWRKRLISYGKLNASKHYNMIREMEAAIDSGCEEVGTVYCYNSTLTQTIEFPTFKMYHLYIFWGDCSDNINPTQV